MGVVDSDLYGLFDVSSLKPLEFLVKDPDLIQVDQMTRRLCMEMSGHLRVIRGGAGAGGRGDII